MSDEEDDYMSDKFLASFIDVRPSLIQERAKKRKLDMDTKQKDNVKRQQKERLERIGANSNERLQESLNQPIASENKGFQLLAKMGYKPGQALGKETATDSSTNTSAKSLTVPIGINLKIDRGGLGRDTALRELAEKRHQLRQQRWHEATRDYSTSTEEFRKRAVLKAEERSTLAALRCCQLTCKNLDTQFDINVPELSWFWPDRLVISDVELDTKEDSPAKNDLLVKNYDDETEEDSDDEFDEYTPAEQLVMLTNYLRTSYKFCYWCGVHYKDAQDLDSNCPGLTRDEH